MTTIDSAASRAKGQPTRRRSPVGAERNENGFTASGFRLPKFSRRSGEAMIIAI
jgi:hypothetical protein